MNIPPLLTHNTGQSSIRPYWRCYYTNTDGIVFVIDSADSDRIQTARSELRAMLGEEELQAVPLLVLANKQDLPGAIDEAGLALGLGLVELRDRPWFVQKTTATSGVGLDQGFDWYAVKGGFHHHHYC